MSATTVAKPVSDAARLGGQVVEQVAAFAAAWAAGGDPPDPARFLPDGPPATRRLVLTELVKLDLDRRLAAGLNRSLEDYIQALPELAAGGAPVDLLYEDFVVRRRAGRDPDPADYFRRFPDRAADLARLLGATVPARSTAVHSTRPPPGLAAGERIDDFDLLALLGEGQFARVYLARQRGMQRLVALKVSADRGAEAQTLAQLDHPHIVRVYDRRAVPGRGLQLVYMTYLPGGTLHEVAAAARSLPPDRRSGRALVEAVDAALARRGEPPVRPAAREGWAGRDWGATVAALGVKLAAALDHAHRQGVLHRDVKPANVLLTADAEPMLADFNVGCCSKVDGAGPAAFFGGSLGYMAPEHLEAFDPSHPRPAESLDGRADVFGLAVTLWELATGDRPFGPEAFTGDWPTTLTAAVARRKAGPEPAAVAAFPDDLPGLREVLLRCLEADADRRPATAGEMARELELCLRPATRELVRPAPGGWRAVVRRHPVAAVLLAGVVPNALGSLFSIAYNQSAIIASWGDAARAVFDRIIPAINGTFFPLGMGLVAAAAWPVGRAVRGEAGAGDAARLRARALALGRITAAVCAGCWVVAGFVWPAAVGAAAGPHPAGAPAYLHFLLSLAACGLIAAAYPYFLVTFVAVRVFYPTLLGADETTPSDLHALRRVERELGAFRAAAAGVPLVAVALLAVGGASDPAAVAVLSAAGLAGVGLAYALEGRTRADLAALAELPAVDGRVASGRSTLFGP